MPKEDEKLEREDETADASDEAEPAAHDHADEFDPGSPAADAPAVF